MRVPDELHKELARQAKDEGVSLNMYLAVALTAIAAEGKVLNQIWDRSVKVTAIEVR
jgi:predicted HicB family RNase H-like nuclease